MKECHVCMAQCEDDAELCPVCGAQLKTDSQKAEEKLQRKTIENPVLAASVEDVVTAEIYRDILSENGIPFSSDETDLPLAQKLYDDVLNSEVTFDDFDGEFEE